jgi:cytoskeletal protein CcmA (bactofilin family)
MSIETLRRSLPPHLAPNAASSPGAVTDVRVNEVKAEAQPQPQVREMVIGREVALSGKVGSCDRLLVEGSVEVTLSDCGAIDISEPGVFKGTASVDRAEISGTFDGTLTVAKRLFIRRTGRVSGTIRYGELEIERGGRLSGDVGTTETH